MEKPLRESPSFDHPRLVGAQILHNRSLLDANPRPPHHCRYLRLFYRNCQNSPLRRAKSLWKRDYASFLLHQIEKPNPSLWYAMLRGYSLRSQHDAVAQFIQILLVGAIPDQQTFQMLRVGAIPDQHTFPVLLKTGSGYPSQIHAHIFKYGLEDDLLIQNSLVSCYAKGGSFDISGKLLDEMPHKDAISWSAILQGHVNNGHPVQCLEYFIKMKSSDVEIDEVTIVTVLNGSEMSGSIRLDRCIGSFYLQAGRVKRDVFVGYAPVHQYAKCGFCDNASKVFDEMPFRNVVSWSSLFSGYLETLYLSSATCWLMVQGESNDASQRSHGLCSIGSTEQGEMGSIAMELKSVVGIALINIYEMCGCIDDAFSIYCRLPNRDAYCWPSLINGFAMHGLGLECLHLF